jgi:hypothetical protein
MQTRAAVTRRQRYPLVRCQAQELVAQLASQMPAAGNFRLLPSGLPKQAEDLLEAYPDADLARGS